VQDVFIAFAQSSGRFRLRGSLKGYLAACTTNRCRDQIRARKRQPLSLNEDAPVQSEFGTPDKRMISDEQSRQVADAMAQLPYEQREVIALHLNAALKLRHIAGLQNVSVSTVKGRYPQPGWCHVSVCVLFGDRTAPDAENERSGMPPSRPAAVSCANSYGLSPSSTSSIFAAILSKTPAASHSATLRLNSSDTPSCSIFTASAERRLAQAGARRRSSCAVASSQ